MDSMIFLGSFEGDWFLETLEPGLRWIRVVRIRSGCCLTKYHVDREIHLQRFRHPFIHVGFEVYNFFFASSLNFQRKAFDDK